MSPSKCINCSKAAKLYCTGCKGCPTSETGPATTATWYCTADCQKEHRATHKKDCENAQARRTLFRAAETAFRLFIILRRANLTLPVERVEKLGAIWALHSLKKRPGTSILLHFPDDTIPSIQDQEAVLTWQKCLPHLADLHKVLKEMLLDLSTSIYEVHFWPKNPPLRLRRVYDGGSVWDSTQYRHWILRVTIKNGEAYAIDITGAQFGWTEHIMPWSHYEQHRIHNDSAKPVEIQPFGRCVQIKAEKYREWNQVPNLSFEEAFNTELNASLHQWAQKNIALSPLLRLPEKKFNEKRSAMLIHIDHHMQAFKKNCIKGKRYEAGNPNEELDAIPSGYSSNP
ncbi:MAG: hypothetical protein Q9170_003019 [Blastenia crenularia]